MIINDFWQSVRPAIAIGKSKGYFTVPLNGFAGNFVGVPTFEGQNTPIIVYQWNYASSNNFTLKFPIAAPTFTNSLPTVAGYPNVGMPYVLCIRYISNGILYRYKLWTLEGDQKIPAQLYTGQKIGKNFCIELWSVMLDWNAIGNNHGADNIVPSGSVYQDAGSFFFPTIQAIDIGTNDRPFCYYYDPKDDGVNYVLFNDNVVVPNKSIFKAKANNGVTPTIGTVFSGVVSEKVTALLKFVPFYHLYLPDVITLHTSQLEVKVSFQSADTFLSVPTGTACDPFAYVSDDIGSNLNNAPALGGGNAKLPIKFNPCISATNNT